MYDHALTAIMNERVWFYVLQVLWQTIAFTSFFYATADYKPLTHWNVFIK